MLRDRWEWKATDDHVHSAIIHIEWQTRSGLFISKNVLIKPTNMSVCMSARYSGETFQYMSQ